TVAWAGIVQHKLPFGTSCFQSATLERDVILGAASRLGQLIQNPRVCSRPRNPSQDVYRFRASVLGQAKTGQLLQGIRIGCIRLKRCVQSAIRGVELTRKRQEMPRVREQHTSVRDTTRAELLVSCIYRVHTALEVARSF